jgi:predicted phage gp36 major capsid-like protein
MVAAVSTGSNIVLAGNFRDYIIVDRLGTQLLYQPMLMGGSNRPVGQAGWFAFFRVGADVDNADSFRLLQSNQVAAATPLG